MRKIFKLIRNEIKVMRLPTLLVVLSLILFSTALFSVLFVSFNLPNSVFAYFDKDDIPLRVFVRNSSANIPAINKEDAALFGEVRLFTEADQIQSKNGAVFKTHDTLETVINGITTIIHTSYGGEAILPTPATLDYFEEYSRHITGELPKNSFEVCLCKKIVDTLSVAIGDSVSIGGKIFKVVGVIEESELSIPAYILSVDETTVFSRLTISVKTSKEAYKIFTKLNIRGLDADISYRQTIDSVSAANIFLIATAVVLFVANLAIIYSMFSLILLNRRAFVCRMKVLGCDSRSLFLVYFLLLIIIIAAVELVAYGLSALVTARILNLCSGLFEVTVTAKGNPLIVFAHFVLLAVIMLLMTMRQVTKIKEDAVIETMRGE